MMNSYTQACDPHRLESFLQGDLQISEEEHLAAHLDLCMGCRARLDQMAADPDAWVEASEFLNPESWLKVKTSTADDNAPLIQSVLNGLNPSDDPEMLGRLGVYEVSGVVGAGGMGAVLKAFDRSLDRSVAIKVLAPHLALNGASRKRFAREAKAAAAVMHPNVVAIHGVSNEQTLPFLVMPYIRGASLQKRLNLDGFLSVSETLRIAAQIAAGLAAAHAHGLVHRDIKPANILLEEGVERVAITDFGLARAVDDAEMTRSGVIAGTPQYMSPEQARGESVDQRSDLFSLGSVMYTMCTGRPPFRAETSYGVMRRITDDDPAMIQELNPEVPEWLCRIISKLLEKNPDNRFASAHELAELLEDCLAYVQQPGSQSLPEILQNTRRFDRIIPRWLGGAAMYSLFGIALMTTFLWQSGVPDISGRWTGNGWGVVVMSAKGEGNFEGTYTDTFGRQPGVIKLKWSRTEGQFSGTWGEQNARFGRISVRPVKGEVRGAWTASKKSTINPGVPRLSDLHWTRLTKGKGGASSMKNQARRGSVNNLKRLMLAMHEYHDVHGHFPPAIVLGRDGEGSVAHSWRIEILPFLGEKNLYEDYHFDEPWDSTHNKQLLDRMPDVFRAPLDNATTQHTSYFGVVSTDVKVIPASELRKSKKGFTLPRGFIFDGLHVPRGITFFWNMRGVRAADITDGTSNTISIVETRRSVPWTKPSDIEYASSKPLPEFGGWYPEGWHVGLGDGSVGFMSSDNDESTVRSLLMINDNKQVVPKIVKPDEPVLSF